MTGGVDEGDGLAARGDDLVGADVLSDAARFARNHIGVANCVEQRGLAVIDMAHDRDDRRARDGRAFVVGPIEEAFLDVGLATRLTEWPISSATSCAVSASSTSVSVTMRPWRIKLIDVDRPLGHAACELLDRDRLRQDDLTCDFLFLVLPAVTFQPLRAPTERSD